VVVHFYDSSREVTDKYKELRDIPRIRRIPERDGFAIWTEWTGEKSEDEIYTCEIHTLRPNKIDDNATMTLGHEMLHCIFGTYHP